MAIEHKINVWQTSTLPTNAYLKGNCENAKCLNANRCQWFKTSHTAFAHGNHSNSTYSLSNCNNIRSTNPSRLQANCPHYILTKIHKAFAWSVIPPFDTIVTPLVSDKNINVDQIHLNNINAVVRKVNKNRKTNRNVKKVCTCLYFIW